MDRQKTVDHQRFFLKLAQGDATVTDDEVEYFRAHPDEIDEISAPVNIHKLFLKIGAFGGILLVGLSKSMKFWLGMDGYLGEFVVDIVFEIGVALIGSGVTAYLLGIVLNAQQEHAARWRTEIRNRIRATTSD